MLLVLRSEKEGDKLIRTYDDHEDSVYGVSWSAKDAWVFASVSHGGQVVFNHVIEPAEEGPVENADMIGRRNNDAIRVILLNHLKKAVQHTPDFANVIGETARRTDAVELVEECCVVPV